MFGSLFGHPDYQEGCSCDTCRVGEYHRRQNQAHKEARLKNIHDQFASHCSIVMPVASMPTAPKVKNTKAFKRELIKRYNYYVDSKHRALFAARLENGLEASSNVPNN